MPGKILISWLPMMLLVNGESVLKLVLRPKADILNKPSRSLVGLYISFKYRYKMYRTFISNK